jgi:hypothetical protein
MAWRTRSKRRGFGASAGPASRTRSRAPSVCSGATAHARRRLGHRATIPAASSCSGPSIDDPSAYSKAASAIFPLIRRIESINASLRYATRAVGVHDQWKTPGSEISRPRSPRRGRAAHGPRATRSCRDAATVWANRGSGCRRWQHGAATRDGGMARRRARAVPVRWLTGSPRWRGELLTWEWVRASRGVSALGYASVRRVGLRQEPALHPTVLARVASRLRAPAVGRGGSREEPLVELAGRLEAALAPLGFRVAGARLRAGRPRHARATVARARSVRLAGHDGRPPP